MTLYELRLILRLLIRSIKISLNIITACIPETSRSDEERCNTSLRSRLPVNYCKAPTVSKVTDLRGAWRNSGFCCLFQGLYARLIHTEKQWKFTFFRNHLVSTTLVGEEFV